jgi:hypothetical protein
MRNLFLPIHDAKQSIRVTVIGGLGWRSRYSVSQQSGLLGDRNPGRANFPAPFQIGPRSQPAFCTVDAGHFPGAQRTERDFDHLSSSSVECNKD